MLLYWSQISIKDFQYLFEQFWTELLVIHFTWLIRLLLETIFIMITFLWVLLERNSNKQPRFLRVYYFKMLQIIQIHMTKWMTCNILILCYLTEIFKALQLFITHWHCSPSCFINKSSFSYSASMVTMQHWKPGHDGNDSTVFFRETKMCKKVKTTGSKITSKAYFHSSG